MSVVPQHDCSDRALTAHRCNTVSQQRSPTPICNHPTHPTPKPNPYKNDQVYEWIRMLRCMPWWDAYYRDRVALGDRKTPDLDGFHYLLRGIELPKVGVWGFGGWGVGVGVGGVAVGFALLLKR